MNGSFIDFLRRVLHLCRKELLVILKDPSSRVILVMPALMQSFLFGYAATYDLTRVDYALLDQSRGGASTALIAKLDGKHWMYQGPQSRIELLKMCDDCRVAVVSAQEFDPYGAPARPKPRTTDDYLRERDQQKK